MGEYERLKAQKQAIEKRRRRDRWRCVLALVRFIAEANEQQLAKVAEYAARQMVEE